MACYSDGYKQKCSIIVIGVSIIMGLMGLVMVIFGAMQSGKVPISAEQKKNLNIPGIDDGAGIGKGNIAVGVLAILISLLGCATGKFKNPCFAIPYGILTFLVGIVFLVIAILCGALSSKQGRVAAQKLMCGGVVSNPQTGQTMKSQVNLSETYKKWVDQAICSQLCPCPAITAFQPDKITQAQLVAKGRWMQGGGYPPRTAAQSDTKPIVLVYLPASQSSKTFNTYAECYKKVLSNPQIQASTKLDSDQKKAIKKFVQSGGFEFLSDIETKFNCAGFCKTPLFYMTKPVSMRPTSECVKPMITKLGDYLGIVAIAAGISFVVNQCGFCGSFSLCTKMEGNDDDK